ncbi:hypothetical protein CK203_111175 [Vitis vinifera]|uniref:Uncharacterized protein n=1 Tax=Vitis vinifera TaxID=29760 RepID=A0A438BLZ0_VITVI|nr:hypothetical protein CK203_111175 [Vitis vinifera]
MWAATSCLGAWRSLYKGAAARFAPFHLQQLGLERESVDLRQGKPGQKPEQGQQGRFYALGSQKAESNALVEDIEFVPLHYSLCVETPVGGKLETEWWNATSYLGGLVAAMWAATSCLGAWRPLYKGAAARFAPFHLQQLGLERESVDLRPYHLIYCLCGTVGPWVKVPKALEEDTPMWVYGVGPTPGF